MSSLESPSTVVSQTRGLACEIKFLIPAGTAPQILEWARGRLAPDPNGTEQDDDSYRTTSLYFDTAELSVFHRQGSYKRSKYRVRRYGFSEYVFLERKLKTRNLVGKRRAIVPLGELPRLQNGTPENGWPGYWFHRRLQVRRLAPICMVSYLRTARVRGTEEGPIRLTLDRSLCACRTGDLCFDATRKSVSLSAENSILELKYLVAMPALFKCLVEEFRLTPVPVSKYRFAVAALDLAGPFEYDELIERNRATAYA